MSKNLKLNITGMTCINCSNAIEKVAKKLDGVIEAKVSFANSIGEFILRDDSVRETLEAKIKKLGYDVATNIDDFEQKRAKHIKNLRNKFIFSLIVSVVIMTLEMSGEQSSFKNFLMLALVLLVIVYAGRDFFTHAFEAVKNRNYDMNVLVALGTGSAFAYSLFVCLASSTLPDALRYMYVSGSAMIITFVLLGKFLEERSKAKAGDYLKALLQIAPKTALVVKPDGQNIAVDVNELNVGDIVVVKNGYNVPCDGVIIQGGAEVDTSALTGESLPIYKKVGDSVFAGTLNTNGYISIKVTKRSNQTLLSQILSLLSDASTKKMNISRFADRVANIFVPSVIAIAIVAFIAWIVLSGNVAYAVSSAICVLIISCPCALGLATPIAIISALARGAKDGILIKNPEVIEIMKDIKFVVFDKTGTLSKGKISVNGSNLSHYHLCLVASVEALSEHHISKAIVAYAEQNCIKPLKLAGKFENIVGFGITYKDENNFIIIGNEKLLNDNNIYLNNTQKADENEIFQSGSGIVLCAINGEFVGFVSLSDELKADAKYSIDRLKSLGVKSIILSGDSENVVSKVASELGVDEFYAHMLPTDKFDKIAELSQQGKVMFVGDGINDSPSLKRADVGIAMNSGSDIAKTAGDIVLIKNNVSGVLNTLSLGVNTIKTIKQNLFWAFVYNALCIPVAAGALYPLFGVLLSPVYGALAMCFSSVTVVLNSLRLRFLNLKG
ncbi:cation-translocating P-type ATPase [Campylobacter sp. faydin G-105]|uniref:heavy metal translocating P-type ATPase n=1 Tax=Campylobacter anatolicus TaxID=2829105 RepID=UPI001B931D35|nr:cation-translocating P-type ATPase [Campylobacter anatolicus]MBR8462497.1 cation-translocating P-type ATPase [Campylobacter anatolicus]